MGTKSLWNRGLATMRGFFISPLAIGFFRNMRWLETSAPPRTHTHSSKRSFLSFTIYKAISSLQFKRKQHLFHNMYRIGKLLRSINQHAKQLLQPLANIKHHIGSLSLSQHHIALSLSLSLSLNITSDLSLSLSLARSLSLSTVTQSPN